MKKQLSFLLAIVVMVTTMGISSCTRATDVSELQALRPTAVSKKVIELTPAEIAALRIADNQTKVGIDEATASIQNILAELDAKATTRSGIERHVRSVTPLRYRPYANTRAEEDGTLNIPDTLAYLLNFAENAGFAIVAADARVLTPILGYTDSGSLETEIPAGLDIFLAGAESYILRSIAEAEAQQDSLLREAYTKMGKDDLLTIHTRIRQPDPEGDDEVWYSEQVEYGSPTVLLEVSPLSKVAWGQGNAVDSAFYMYLDRPSCSSGHTPAGCVAVALAHIMSYWQFPTSLSVSGISGFPTTISYNWAQLNQRTGYADNNWGSNVTGYMRTAPAAIQQQAGKLMRQIGHAIDMDYECEGSGASTVTGVNYLKSLGYTGGTGYDFSYAQTKSSLLGNRPVIIRGTKDLDYDWLFIPDGIGHTWIVDGVSERSQTYWQIQYTGTGHTNSLEEEIIFSEEVIYGVHNYYYLHYNWGNYGEFNGWFESGCFEMTEGEDFHYNVSIYTELAHY
ncbi:MAG: C10 family peptidase [Prevotellaceae bacterium]|jgi:hypothetical protein|nr:C10 family peptidase [Prevotellaceae bacterium]